VIAIVERGNTRTKLSVMDIKANIIRFKSWNEFNIDIIHKSLSKDFQDIRYCNTSRNFEVIPKNWHEVFSTSEWPIQINYSKNIGVDRLAGVTGARVISKKKSLLVISCGTCLTFSHLNVKNRFQGGAISPGLSMRIKSMSDYTNSLPLLEPGYKKKVSQDTDNTETSMQKGAYEGMLFEIQHRISLYKRVDPDIQIFITGGDGPAFAESLEYSIFANPNLEAIGLFAQWSYEKNR
jgi:type III pantothenate kinase